MFHSTHKINYTQNSLHNIYHLNADQKKRARQTIKKNYRSLKNFIKFHKEWTEVVVKIKKQKRSLHLYGVE